MKALECQGPLVHVFVCTNERVSAQVSCAAAGGEALYMALKMRLIEQGLSGTHWATRTGCLGFCHGDGTTVLVQPKGKPARWFHQVRIEDLEKLWKEILS